ncbi:sulfatase family protein [Microbulbifer sp.]|uniref:sulfatase family protein n=1 Tax=Microbulbifer sp. TaxID=1908541 RepID=UPI003F35C2B5
MQLNSMVKRRLLLFLAAIAALFLAFWLMQAAGPQAVSAQQAQAPPERRTAPVYQRPNIVLVVFEDMSPRVGAYGDALAKTPSFDRIAAEGVRYTNAFTTAGVCAPSRAALITGRYQQTIGAQHMRTHNSKPGFTGGGPAEYMAVPPPEVKAFPEVLRRAGYYAINNGKTDYQFGEPFTVWDQSGPKADWSERPAGSPFFSMINLLTTHEVFLYPPDFTPSSATDNAVAGHVRRQAAARKAVTDPAAVTVPPYLPDTPQVRGELARLYDNTHYTDARLGEIYQRLQREGLLQNTILIVTTDHGDGLPRAKRSLYDSGLRVPLVVRYPDGWGGGGVNEELVSFVDLGPTILSWAGIDKPVWMQGHDLSSTADREGRRDYVFAARDRTDELPARRRAVRDRRYKYIRNLDPGQPFTGHIAFRDRLASMQALWLGHRAGTLPPAAEALFEPLPAEQLYDTLTDPDEVHNLAASAEHRQTRERLRRALDEWLARVGDLPSMSEEEMIQAMWPDGIQPQTPRPKVRVLDTGKGQLVDASAVDNASIGYRFAADPEGHWRLYVAPFPLPPGQTVELKAVRYGYAESPVVEVK